MKTILKNQKKYDFLCDYFSISEIYDDSVENKMKTKIYSNNKLFQNNEKLSSKNKHSIIIIFFHSVSCKLRKYNDFGYRIHSRQEDGRKLGSR